MNETCLNYDDVILNNPTYSEINSRDDIEVSIKFGGHTFKSPAIPANMKTAINFEMAEKLANSNYFYILHRFYEYSDILNWLEQDTNFIKSISVGIKQKDYDLIDSIRSKGISIDYITIDVAHGHHIGVKNMISYIRDKLGGSVFIIAGNACTLNACYDFAAWGADAAKVGLSMGKGCSTYNSTGVGSPMFSTVKSCSDRSIIPIIADGGIRDVSDICKALVAGATMVMIGSEFVKCIDSPATNDYHEDDLKYISVKTDALKKLFGVDFNISDIIKPKYKIYYGSASSTNKGSKKYVEGLDHVRLPCNNMYYLDYLQKVHDGVVSCMSYHNLRDIDKMSNIRWSEYKR